MKVNLFLSVVLCVSALACADPGDDPASPTAIPKLAANALDPSTLWGSGPALITGVLNTANKQTMAASSTKRVVFSYAIKCALSSTQTISVTVGGVTYNYTGQVGLATSWTTAALTTTQKRAVSACIISLTNYFSTSVTVSLRGDGLPLDGTEGSDYAVQEGAFWGDVFLGASSWGSACNGRDQVLDDTYGDLPMRECAEPDAYGIATPCAFNYAGLCTDVCTGNNTYLGYSGCSDGINPTTSDVMTAYLYGHL